MTSGADRASKRKFIGAVEDEWPVYSDRAQDYTFGPPIGFGASSIVYAATYKPTDTPSAKPIPCAVKVLDLDSLPPHALHLLRRETTLMSLSKHPNVLRVRGSWIDGHHLCIALRLMNAGSAADVMRYAWPGGMEEEVVKCILKQALEGLNYLHVNGFIHRDIKAANMLIDDDGTVLLGDLGVAADLYDDGHGKDPESHRRKAVSFDPVISARSSTAATPSARPPMMKRKSFVGTPCWMAPEVINGKQYDASADIWSFGITAIELTQGRPPRSRESSHKVLLQTVQDAAPTVSRTGGDGSTSYSRAFAETVSACISKDPTARPTAAQLLASPFFRTAKKKSFLVGAVLRGLPPLAQRQERIRAERHRTHATVDSWDFAATLASHPGSPTATHFRRPHSLVALDEVPRARARSGSAGTSVRGSAGGGARTPLLERPEGESSAGSVRSAAARSAWSRRGGSRNHSRNVSWGEDDRGEPLIFPVDAPAEVITEDAAERAPAPDGDDSAAAAQIPHVIVPEPEVGDAEDEASPAGTGAPGAPDTLPEATPSSPVRSLALAVPALSCSPSSASSGPSLLATPPSPLALLRLRSDGGPTQHVPTIGPSPHALHPKHVRTASSPAQSPATPSPPSLWRMLTGGHRPSASENKDRRRSGLMGGLLARSASNGGGGSAGRAKMERAQSERG